MFRHLLPNVSNIIIVTLTIALGAAGAAEIALTFLGVGVQEAPSFGVLIGDYAGAVQAHPRLVVYPAIMVIVLIFAFNLLGDALTDVLSPRRR
jgi:ABC-type dipeptide/oligopeptide/nickel transport system permease subunit